jgi:hypothetical protein
MLQVENYCIYSPPLHSKLLARVFDSGIYTILIIIQLFCFCNRMFSIVVHKVPTFCFFNRFSTTVVRKVPGCFLGLSTVSALALKH